MLGTATTNLVNKQVSDFVKTIGIVMLLWIVSLVVGYFTGVVQEQTIQSMSRTIRLEVAKGLENMTPENYNSRPDSEYQALLQSNVTFLENNGFQSVYRMMRFVGNASFSLLALLFYDWRLFVLSILLSALLLFVPRTLSKYTKKGGKLISSGNSQLMNRVSEAIKGHQNLAALSAYSYFCALIDRGS
ncbi:hypothetical protein KIMC2_08420 [Xylocopilactobacillus apis]|uniref:ABC transmembrane type-1 domain-containing protein n=2 Tax=Xylocopilactobacillus apis TaxID=2932183 RepID=A0AAU9D9D7_9LACO|nr:hypothetical protein KIMC2_08420 [Xylocopilactobacillus apis]